MSARFYCPLELVPGGVLSLPANAARHVQVLRLQPGDSVTLFNGHGGEAQAQIARMGRSEVQVCVSTLLPIERESPWRVHLAMGMPANERMDWLVEKATELGVCSIQPLLTERSVLRLHGERSERKQAHWQSVAAAACEQCGRNRLPLIHPVQSLGAWLQSAPALPAARQILSLAAGSQAWAALPCTSAGPGADLDVPQDLLFLSGPEGGFSAAEEALALAAGFSAVHLGPRVLRAETAALAVLAAATLR